ncbi:negative regulator of systemic acquired resistance SNI1 isoform X1 [Olea europaea subsp. europaea]|uniref:Negative regulator of systemic acquired resistance SNI1 isoform X1 n=2 Tax=Olea europaea subsp. europaea TaxID=158383 RepID=A0A8S0RRA1_OLEEU|nr:negative regulator of systemic acquired resistance SNI1 isoform X1 [Olea europaea subsp. europaea]
MENRKGVAGGAANRGLEENTMAILDTSGFNSSKICHHLNDDRLAFLEAVRCASLLSINGTAPTSIMFEAVFQILKDEDSLDLIMESYQLLVDLNKRFPRVYLSKTEKSESSSSNVMSELVVVQEAWSPFSFGLDSYNEKAVANKQLGGSVDSLSFHALIQEVVKVSRERKSEAVEIKFLRNMLLLQYLIIILEDDFLPRNSAYQENMNWTLLRESLLNMLLGSRKIIYKSFIQDCLCILCDLTFDQTELSSEMSHNSRHSGDLSDGIDTALVLALPEVEKSTCSVLKKLVLMIMELDLSRSMADLQGSTTRADGVRTPAVDIMLEELIYNSDILSSFLQVFDEPKWKLKVIVEYFQKYIPKSSVRTRRSNGQVKDQTFDEVLKCFSNSNSTKSIVKKLSIEVAQLLLAHAFQAYLSLSLQHLPEGSSELKEDVKGSSLAEVCKNLISAFTSLRREDKETEILPFGKEALFTAATILSTKS